MSESILEDELFGHVRGAFTGANTEREGRFEHADGGTLFMDEIGDMPGAMQAKLLRVLENGEVVRVGSNEPIRVDVRLISATNRKLEEMVAERHFREDLYFRIKGITILSTAPARTAGRYPPADPLFSCSMPPRNTVNPSKASTPMPSRC